MPFIGEEVQATGFGLFLPHPMQGGIHPLAAKFRRGNRSWQDPTSRWFFQEGTLYFSRYLERNAFQQDTQESFKEIIAPW